MSALCAQTDPEIFFPTSRNFVAQPALDLCNGVPASNGRPAREACPILASCREETLAFERAGDLVDIHGVQAGMTAQARRDLIHEERKVRSIELGIADAQVDELAETAA